MSGWHGCILGVKLTCARRPGRGAAAYFSQGRKSLETGERPTSPGGATYDCEMALEERAEFVGRRSVPLMPPRRGCHDDSPLTSGSRHWLNHAAPAGAVDEQFPYFPSGTEPSRYRQFLMNAIRSAICSMGIFFSRPSGISDIPFDFSSSISWRRTRAVLPSGWRNVIEFAVSAPMIPVSLLPSLVTIV